MDDIVDYPAHAPAWSPGWNPLATLDGDTDVFPVISLGADAPPDYLGGLKLLGWISLLLIAIAVLGYVAH